MNEIYERIDFQPLVWLEGSWHGKGVGQFPTVTPFQYSDKMIFKFTMNRDEPLIHFEEYASLMEGTRLVFKHWETGFFRELEDGIIELQICHNTGRIEILTGAFEEVDFAEKSFDLIFKSKFVHNAKGLTNAVSSARRFQLINRTLFYSHEMATTEIDEMAKHLTSKLQKE